MIESVIHMSATHNARREAVAAAAREKEQRIEREKAEAIAQALRTYRSYLRYENEARHDWFVARKVAEASPSAANVAAIEGAREVYRLTHENTVDFLRRHGVEA